MTAPNLKPPKITGAPWLKKPETQAVFAALNRDGHSARAVGGAVRNTLMGLPVRDIDLATTARPDLVIKFAHDAGLSSIPTGLKHGTVTIVANHVPFEVTTLREDVETFGRHAEVAFTEDWTADASRRDFTMNALYCSADGTVHDPLGGYDDLANRRVRFIGNAEDRIQEDYLRILRFFRFSAEYVTGAPDANGYSACIANLDGLTKLSGERIRSELLRIFLARGAVNIVRIMSLSEIYEAAGITGEADTLSFTNLARIEARLDLKRSALLRLAALWLIDEASAQTMTQRLKLSNEERNRLHQLAAPEPAVSPNMPDKEGRSNLYKLGPDAFRDRVLFTWSRDAQGEPAFAAWTNLYRLPDRWTPPACLIKGADAIAAGLAPSPTIGELVRKLEDAWIASDFTLTRKDLLKMLQQEISGTTKK